MGAGGRYNVGMTEALAKTVKPCPHCGKPAPWEANPWRPFCSERCRLTDLGNWASGAYRIPGPPMTSETDKERAEDEALAEKPADEDKETT